MNNLTEIGEILISKGADINAKTIVTKNSQIYGRSGCLTPLMIALENHSKEMIELLISKGADINVKNINYRIIVLLFFN